MQGLSLYRWMKGWLICSAVSIRHRLPKRNSKTRTSLWHCTVILLWSWL